MSAIGLTGIILKGRYCIIEQIGQGGQGTMYLARDLELGKLWAVKELPLERKKEAKLMRLLEHPYLPKMTDYTERGEFCYLVMEFIRGRSLGEWLEEGRTFSLEEILKVGMTASEVLYYLHTQKPPVYYGDLKPDNLMMTENGQIYLVDLGSAVFGYTEKQKICQGTVGYAAPEQFKGRVSGASDIYALGRTLSLLCGKNKMRYILNSPGFGMLLWRCCRKEEHHRYHNMDTVHKQIKAILKKTGYQKQHGISFLPVVFLLVSVLLLWDGLTGPSFEEALSGITESYYAQAFLEGTYEERKEICHSVEKRLQGMLKNYPEKEFQRRLLLLLAINGELEEEEERAAVYYEQLLLYDTEFGEGYGQYGLFLCRQGIHEESRRLFARYERIREKGKLEELDRRLEELWKEELGVQEKTRNKKNTKEDSD